MCIRDSYQNPLLPLLHITHWCYLGLFGSFLIITIAHFVNDDFSKRRYIPPRPVVAPFQVTDRNITNCAKLWKWGSVMYQFTPRL